MSLAKPTISVAGRGSRSTVVPVSELDFSANDYLGLRNDPRVRAAAVRGIEEFGVGSGGVRDVAVGTSTVQDLECRLARFKAVRDVRVVQSGYAANLGIVPLLVGEGDTVILDRGNHQSSKDGARLSGATVAFYRHADLLDLARELEKAARAHARRIVVITDGVFGTGGDIAPLPDIVGLAERHGATVLVDDAHGSGVLGKGSGTVAHFGLTDRIAVQVGTASKAMGVVGGYIAAQADEVIAKLGDARTVVNSTALPPHLAMACIAALDIIESEPERIDRLWSNRRRLADGLVSAGLDIGGSQTPIVPVITGDPGIATSLGERIRERGVQAAVLVPPKVAREDSRLRLIATAAHSTAGIDQAVAVIADAARRSGLRLARA
jgi:glycine C-acetyltransferase